MERDLIDAYLAELRRTLAGRADLDDVVDEVADHLRENVARQVAAGASEGDAQHRTLECFGDVGLVARAFVTSSSGGVAVPTRFTRLAGAAGIAAAAFWTARAAIVLVWAHTGLVTEDTGWLWLQATFSSTGVATLLCLVMVLGALRRAGSLRSPVALGAAALLTWTSVTALTGNGMFATELFGISGTAVLVACLGLRGVPRLRRAFLTLGAVWLVGSAANYPFQLAFERDVTLIDGAVAVLNELVFVATLLGGAAALLVTGLRLVREVPVDLDRVPPVVPLAG